MGKLMINGDVANKTIETLGIHTGTTASKKLDIPLVADRVGKYSEADIDGISENLTKVIPKAITIISTTDASGNIALLDNTASNFVLSVITTGPALAIPFYYSATNKWYAKICDLSANMTAIPNSQIECIVYYIE